ncbi:phospho-sugar mutase [Erysipelothrix urinaevulpis]|uniref:phospho-sugar mutase n=1 Tax=Erysipelothrix urinaevulpis TaxID=2683717 RepID=UPI00135A9387|nr:phospho-sugar mutase [Erysipelothrix urinaevulpis]
MEKWIKKAELYPWIEEGLKILTEEELHDSFYKNLEFGTAGMRGLLGVGPNRMNLFTVAKASLGFGEYLSEKFPNEEKSIAIAYDNRHMSKEFAEISALMLSRFNIKSYIFDNPRPTPELSFTVRELGCVGGIVITASHNPKEYNGFKVYDETGCQLVDHKIARVIELIDKVEDLTDIDLNDGDASYLEYIGASIDSIYLDRVRQLQLNEDNKKVLKIIFSSQHGTAYPYVYNLLKESGYDVILVEEQSPYDPDFSMTKTPNPEDHNSYDLAIEYAKKYDADLILSVDPDADRMGIVVKHEGDYHYLTGNQGGAILQEYLYSTMLEKDLMPPNPVMFNTVVTSDLGDKIAENYNVEVEKTLTGFKYIGEKIEGHNQTGDKEFVFGYEESYGYLIKDFVRDKDAVQACLMVAEASNAYALENLTLIDVLNQLFDKYGYYYETQDSHAYSGAEGLDKIKQILHNFRHNKIESIGNQKVLSFDDYLVQRTSSNDVIDLPKSNVLKYYLEDGSWLAVRPSGTEPKCKFYYCVVGSTEKDCVERYEAMKTDVEKIMNLS